MDGDREKLLKRVQIGLAIVTGVASLAVGLYNVKANFFSDKSPGRILLTVVAEDQRPASRVRAEAINSQGSIVLAGQTDGEGQIELGGLIPGGYTVKVAAPGFEPQIVTVQVAPRRTTDAAIVIRRLSSSPVGGTAIRSAIEEVGASWIKRLGEPSKSDGTQSPGK